MNEEQRKTQDKARGLIAVAYNEASSETDKKNAFKQVLKNLEGVVDVPEVAIDAFKHRIGMPELEA